ncbi:MAG: glycosyltransferase [Nitrosopumilus sp.]|nr:glycosyltransferase [Nitrosopumilus sp.]
MQSSFFPKKRCLFLVEDYPISPNATGGGSSMVYSHLELLFHAGFDITLILLRNPHTPKGFVEYTQNQPVTWNTVKSWCKSYHMIEVKRNTEEKSRMARLYHLILALLYPIRYKYNTISKETNEIFKKLLIQIQPDMIWTEHQFPAILAQNYIQETPIIFSHTDWLWRIKKLRQKDNRFNLRFLLNIYLLKRLEVKLVQKVSGCVSGSIKEAFEIEMLSRKPVIYLPATYPLINPVLLKETHSSKRIFHLGGMSTTANRIGLQRFIDVVWPTIREFNPELWVIGSLEGAGDLLLDYLKKENIICTGFINDLSSVLRPYDIHIIPWEYNTGTRTRIPLVLSHKQVLLSTRAAAACLPELINGENCILVDDLTSMGSEITKIFSNQTLRIRLANSGYETFKKSFTRESLQQRFNRYIAKVL